MKLIAFFTLLILGYLSHSASAGKKEDCAIHRPKAYAAINKFCIKGNIMVPSAYAVAGKQDDEKKAAAIIFGNCSPPQWIPNTYCRSQFYDMCSGKTRSRKYGKNNCQSWRLDYDGDYIDVPI